MKEFIYNTIKLAGRHLRDNFSSELIIEKKGMRDPVTQIDKETEIIIVNEITKYFPSHSIITEEELSTEKGDETWIIDPLDGTCNYAHRIPHFGVSIAFMKNNEITHGAVYDPSRDELFYAEKNKGAFLNDKRINVSSNDKLMDCLLATGFAYNRNDVEDTNVDNFNKFIMDVQDIRRKGSAALDLCYVACGRFDGFWELYLHKWDVAAGMLLVSEANGIVTDKNNKPYKLGEKLIIADNGLIHEKMLKRLA